MNRTETLLVIRYYAKGIANAAAGELQPGILKRGEGQDFRSDLERLTALINSLPIALPESPAAGAILRRLAEAAPSASAPAAPEATAA